MRTLKWRWIYLIMALEATVYVILNVLSSGTVALLLWPLFAMVGGWQMGVMSERNDWIERNNGDSKPEEYTASEKGLNKEKNDI